MYSRSRSRSQKVTCKFHPGRRCEHFCRDHSLLLCSYCLRDKHPNCQVSDENDYKVYYGGKVRTVREHIEGQRNQMLSHTQALVSALEGGIGRLHKYKKELDVTIDRISDMKYEVLRHETGLNMTTQALHDIDRTLVNAYDIQTCQQCYTDIDQEKAKFQRKQRKLLQVPTRLNEELDGTLVNLQRKLKNIRHGLTSHISSTKLHLQGNARSFKSPSTPTPTADIRPKGRGRVTPTRNQLSNIPDVDSQFAHHNGGPHVDRAARFHKVDKGKSTPSLPVISTSIGYHDNGERRGNHDNNRVYKTGRSTPILPNLDLRGHRPKSGTRDQVRSYSSRPAANIKGVRYRGHGGAQRRAQSESSRPEKHDGVLYWPSQKHGAYDHRYHGATSRFPNIH